MATASLPLIPGTIPEGFCPESYQDLFNKIAKYITVQFESSSFTTIIRSGTAPGATDRDKSWHNTDDDRMYRWDNSEGAWVNRHELAPGGGDRRLVELSILELDTYDGGEAGTVGNASGPMWEEDTEYRGRFAIGAGAIPGRTLTPTTTVVGDEGGLAEVTQTAAQVAPHEHDFTGPALTGSLSNSGDNAVSIPSLPAVTSTTEENQASATPMENLPPYRALRYIKRTARIYRKGA